ncbi:MAG: hypothetical protein ACT4O9_04740 [Blastocatellia bacterium]
MKTITSIALLFTLIFSSIQSVAAKPKGDWNAVKSLEGREVAVKLRRGMTRFAIIASVEEDGIKLRVADKSGVSNTETSFRKDEIEKVWIARLRFGGRQTGKGALFGLGAGTVVGTGVYLGTRSRDDNGLSGAAIPLGAFYGAGIGAVIGFFSKRSHKKADLVYSV